VSDCIAQFHPLCGRQHGLLSYLCLKEESVGTARSSCAVPAVTPAFNTLMCAVQGHTECYTASYMYCEKHTRFIQAEGLSAANLDAINKALKRKVYRIAEESAKSLRTSAGVPAAAPKKRQLEAPRIPPPRSKSADQVVASDEEFASSGEEDDATMQVPRKVTAGAAGSLPTPALPPKVKFWLA
jgi:hypothetical protein